MIVPILFPILAGCVCLLLPKKAEKLLAPVAVLGSLITIFFIWRVFRAGNCLLDYGGWLHLKNDALSGFVLLGITIFGLFISFYSIGSMAGKERLREYYTYLLWTIGISCGAVLANDFILLLSCWGFLGLTLYLMIGISGPDAAAAAKKSFLIIGGTDCLLIVGIGIIRLLNGSTAMDLQPILLDRTLACVAFVFIVSAAFAKAGAMPFHTWVPDCGEKAPVSVTAFLPASLDKLLGIYLLARVALDVFEMNPAMLMFLQVIGACTIIFAVMMALVQHDMKRLLSYHAVSQVGYMVLGIGTGTPIGIAGGLFHMLNHAMYKACLFLCAGNIEKKGGTADLDKLGGMAKLMPLTFFAFIVAALAISGIPPLNGFASKWMVYQGIVESGKSGGALWVIWLVAAMLGSALTLASFVKILHAVFLRKPSPEVAAKKISEVGITMWLPMVSLAVLCLIFGIFALRLPLKHFILPAVGDTVSFVGVWWSGPATVMLVVGVILGFVIYFLTTVRKARECETYIGGEILDTVYISDEPVGKERNIDITGVDFYRNIQKIKPLNQIYKLAEKKVFDIYVVGTGFVFYFVEILRKAHNGVLPVYLTYYIAGFVGVILVLMGRVG